MKYIRNSALVQTGRKVKERRKTAVGSYRPPQRDIFRDQLLTPHVEMRRVMEAVDQNTFFNAAAETSRDFIMGEGLEFESDNEYAKDMVEAYWESLQGDLALRDAIKKTILTGNGYNEKDFYDPNMTGGILVPSKIYAIPDPSQIYINCNEYGEPLKVKKKTENPDGSLTTKKVPNYEEYYIQELNPNMQHPKASRYQISYNGQQSNLIGRNSHYVYGIPIDQRKVTHFKLGYGDNGLYGRSAFASAINDHEMLFEIERAIATIAKYKAVPRKVWQYGNKDLPATDDDIDELLVYLETLDMEDDIIVNKPVATTDLSYAGKEIRLEYAINHIKKKMIAGVSLDFLSGMGQDVNRATAQQELMAFILSIYSKRKLFLKIIEEEFIKPYCKWKGLDPVTPKFPMLDFETKNEKEGRIRANWQSNMLTFNEMRKEMGLPELDEETRDEEKLGDMLFTELQMNVGPDMGGFDMLDGFGEEEEGEEGDGFAEEEVEGGGGMDDALYDQKPMEMRTRENYPQDPSRTKMIRRRMAIGIRKVYRERLRRILKKIERHKREVRENVRLEATIGVDVLDEIMKAMDNAEVRTVPVVSKALNEAWGKANQKVKQMTKKQISQGNQRVLKALQKNAFGFIKKHDEDLTSGLRMALTEGISQGDSITDIKKDVREIFKKTSHKSETISRTEVMRTYNTSSIESMKEANVRKYKWLTAGDNRVDLEHCKPKHGNVYEVGKGPLPITDTHPNCRCSVVPVVEEQESFRTQEGFEKEIDFETFMDKYHKVLLNPAGSSVFYSEDPDQRRMEITIIYDSTAVKTELTFDTWMEYQGVTDDDMTEEDKDRQWRSFKDIYLKSAVEEQ